MFFTCILADASEPVLVENYSNVCIDNHLNCYKTFAPGCKFVRCLPSEFMLEEIAEEVSPRSSKRKADTVIILFLSTFVTEYVTVCVNKKSKTSTYLLCILM